MGLAGTQQNPSPATNQPLSPQGSWGEKGTQRTKQGQATLYYWLGLALGSEQNSSKNSWALPSQLEQAEHEGSSWTLTARSSSCLWQEPATTMTHEAESKQGIGVTDPMLRWSKPRPPPQIPSSQGRGSECSGGKDQENERAEREKNKKMEKDSQAFSQWAQASSQMTVHNFSWLPSEGANRAGAELSPSPQVAEWQHRKQSLLQRQCPDP